MRYDDDDIVDRVRPLRHSDIKFFLDWLQDKAKYKPNTKFYLASNIYGLLGGIFPNEPDGTEETWYISNKYFQVEYYRKKTLTL